MKTTPLQEHPLYIWLRKDKDYNAIFKFVNFIPSLKENTLSPSDNTILFNQAYFFLQNHFYSDASVNSLLGKKTNPVYGTDEYLSEDSRIMRAFQHLQELMPLDVNKKSIMWQDRHTALMDQFKPMSDFFDRDYPEHVKGKGFKRHGAELLTGILVKAAPDVRCCNDKKLSEVINVFDSRFKRYNAKPNWNELMKKNPSLFLALYANKEGYEVKYNEFQTIFNSFASMKRNGLKGYTKDDAYKLGNIFAELLANSLYFKNSLAPTKDIKATLKKFLDEVPKDNPSNEYDYFIKAAIINPAYEMQKMVLDIDKKNRVQTMGKSNLNKQEAEIYEKKQKEQLAQTPRPRKMKI